MDEICKNCWNDDCKKQSDEFRNSKLSDCKNLNCGMSDLINRKALLDWVNKQVEEVTKKQVAGTDGSIFTRESLVAMQRCLSTFETAINNQPTAYDVEKVVEELKESSYQETADDCDPFGDIPSIVVPLNKAIDIVKKGGN